MPYRMIARDAWSTAPDVWKGELNGRDIGAGLSLIFVSEDEVGAGPRLHRHAYAETFVVRAGAALFTVEGEEVRAEAGQIVTVPAGSAHKFTNLGPGRLETIDLHESDRIVTEWLA